MGQTVKKHDESNYQDYSAIDRLIELLDEASARTLEPARDFARRCCALIRSPRFARAVAAYDRGADDAAFRQFRQLAESGHANAQYHLGVMYSEGHGTARDDTKAMYWFARAAEQGDLNAGFMHALRH